VRAKEILAYMPVSISVSVEELSSSSFASGGCARGEGKRLESVSEQEIPLRAHRRISSVTGRRGILLIRSFSSGGSS
jgi:hypothetical protein